MGYADWTGRPLDPLSLGTYDLEHRTLLHLGSEAKTKQHVQSGIDQSHEFSGLRA